MMGLRGPTDSALREQSNSRTNCSHGDNLEGLYPIYNMPPDITPRIRPSPSRRLSPAPSDQVWEAAKRGRGLVIICASAVGTRCEEYIPRPSGGLDWTGGVGMKEGGRMCCADADRLESW